MRHFLLLTAMLWAGASCAVVPTASVTPRVGILDIEGDISASSSGVSASSDADRLGFSTEYTAIAPRADLEWLGLHVTGTASLSNHDGNGTAESQLDIGGVTINPGDPVRAKLDLGLYNLYATWDVVPTDLLEVGLGLGAAVVDFDARLTSETSGMTGSSAETFLLPMIAGRMAVHLGPFELSALVGGMSLGLDGDRFTAIDLDVMGTYYFGSVGVLNGGLTVGYRHLLFDAEYEDDSSDINADVSFGGPYVGLTISL